MDREEVKCGDSGDDGREEETDRNYCAKEEEMDWSHAERREYAVGGHGGKDGGEESLREKKDRNAAGTIRWGNIWCNEEKGRGQNKVEESDATDLPIGRTLTHTRTLLKCIIMHFIIVLLLNK